MLSQDILPLVVFSIIACGTYVLFRVFDPQRARVQSRVDELMSAGTTHPAFARTLSDTTSSTAPDAASWLHRVIPTSTVDRESLQKRFAKAGIYNQIAVSRFLTLKFLFTTIPLITISGTGFLGYVPLELALPIGFTAGCIGAVAPGIWLDRCIARRHIHLRRSLPDFLDLMIVCLEGGMSLQETMRRVSEELQLAHPTLAFEMGIVQRDVELGATVDQALKKFAVRTDYDGARTLSTFIREAQRFGTNITEALRSHADMLRSQREQIAEETAQKAAVKILFPTLLFIFPAIFVVLVGPAIIQVQEAFAKN